MSAVGSSSGAKCDLDDFITINCDSSSEVKKSLERIQNLLTFPLILEEGDIPKAIEVCVQDGSASSSGSCVFMPTKPYRYGSIKHYAHEFNDPMYHESLDLMVKGVVKELENLMLHCNSDKIDLRSIADEMEISIAFPVEAEGEQTGVLKLISSLFHNIEFIDSKLMKDGLKSRTSRVILTEKAGQERSEKYWNTVTSVYKFVCKALHPSSPGIIDFHSLAKVIENLESKGLRSAQWKHNDAQWKEAKMVLEKNNWYIDDEILTPEMKSLIRHDIQKDLNRTNFLIDGKDFSKSGHRLDEMLATIKSTIFGESEDIHDVALRLGFFLTQGTLAIPNTSLFLMQDNPFGSYFHFDKNSPIHNVLNFDKVTNAVSIHTHCTQLSYTAEGEPNGKVLIAVDLNLNIVSGNIDWKSADARYSFTKLS